MIPFVHGRLLSPSVMTNHADIATKRCNGQNADADGHLLTHSRPSVGEASFEPTEPIRYAYNQLHCLFRQMT